MIVDRAISTRGSGVLTKLPASVEFDPRLGGDVPGGAFESEDLPDPPGMGFIRPSNRDHPTRDGGLDLAAPSERAKLLPNSGGTGCTSCCQVLAGRKPLFVVRFDGAFLLRFAERTFAG